MIEPLETRKAGATAGFGDVMKVVNLDPNEWRRTQTSDAAAPRRVRVSFDWKSAIAVCVVLIFASWFATNFLPDPHMKATKSPAPAPAPVVGDYRWDPVAQKLILITAREPGRP